MSTSGSIVVRTCCGGGATVIHHGVRDVGLVGVPGRADAQVLCGIDGHVVADFGADLDFRVVVLPQVRHVVHRAGVADPPGPVAGRRRRQPRTGRGLQGVAEPTVPAARRRVRAPMERRAPGTAHVLRHELVRAGASGLVRLWR